MIQFMYVKKLKFLVPLSIYFFLVNVVVELTTQLDRIVVPSEYNTLPVKLQSEPSQYANLDRAYWFACYRMEL